MRNLVFTLFALVAFSLPAAAQDQNLGDLVLQHAWARATPGGAKTGAAYVRIENRGMAADQLIGAASPIAAKVGIHTMSTDSGTMVMGPAGDVEVPAQGMVELKPHGLHIMMMGLTKPLREGETFPVTLTFEKAGSVELQVVVEPIGSDGSDHQVTPAEDGAE